MKKVRILLVAIVAVMLVFVSCSKIDEDAVNPNGGIDKVNIFNGSYVVKNGNGLTMKSSNLDVTQITWTMLAINSPYYPAAERPLALVKGKECITGLDANNWWSADGNNPVTFPIQPGVYSNLTPDEDLQLIAETKNAQGEVVYLAIKSFNPDANSFPLNMNGFQLGDKDYVDVSDIAAMAGSQYFTIKADFDVYPVNIEATKWKVYPIDAVTGIGTEFGWSDIVYDAANKVHYSVNIPVTSTPTEIYNSLAGKIMGNVTVTISESAHSGASASSVSLTKAAAGPGEGATFVVSSGKTGTFDSQTITWHNTPITMTTIPFVFE